MTEEERRERFQARIRDGTYEKDGVLYWSRSDQPVPDSVLDAARPNPAPPLFKVHTGGGGLSAAKLEAARRRDK